MPISKNEQKLIRSLAYGKYRQRHGLFVAEGEKVITTLAMRWQPVKVFATDKCRNTRFQACEIIDEKDLQSVSFLQHPQGMLALFPLPPTNTRQPTPDNLSLALDGIQDPGNLGTILRIADWFGIRQIVCSNDTTDAFSPKAVQASMGSLAHVDVAYTDLPQWLNQLPNDIPIFTTSMQGENIYATPLPGKAVIIMGNEGNGVRPEVMEHTTHVLTIPSYGAEKCGAESLNVAMATAIICAEWQRQISDIKMG